MGIPPFSGFWAKYYVFKAAIGAGLWPIAVIGLVSSVVAAFYYLRLVKTMWFDPSPGQTDHLSGPTRAAWRRGGAVLLPAGDPRPGAAGSPGPRVAASAFRLG